MSAKVLSDDMTPMSQLFTSLGGFALLRCGCALIHPSPRPRGRHCFHPHVTGEEAEGVEREQPALAPQEGG